ncbi:MAG: hypothetical protein MUE96_08825 [Bacteroidia bacterium]|nr:hypothetical protein [Bacteroidia bacterium]
MKKVLSILLVLALFFQFSIKIGIVGYFIIHQDYIEKYLCINRDRPELECKGKCQLKKQLQKEAENERKLPSSSVKEIIETLVFFESHTITAGLFLNQQPQIKLFAYSFSCINATLDTPFHPPCV